MPPHPRRRASRKRRAAYRTLLRDPRWQQTRLRVFERDHWTCQGCGATTRTLHVHHRWYQAGVLPWAYPDTCYVTVCLACHKAQPAPRRVRTHREVSDATHP